jgi:hypothetical protein
MHVTVDLRYKKLKSIAAAPRNLIRVSHLYCTHVYRSLMKSCGGVQPPRKRGWWGKGGRKSSKFSKMLYATHLYALAQRQSYRKRLDGVRLVRVHSNL